MTTIIKAETAPYIEAFRARPLLAEPSWLTARREAALARFAELGFPTRRQEMWRFTDLRPLQRGIFPPAPAESAAGPLRLDAQGLAGAAHRLVFVNGRFAPDLSAIGDLPRGAWLASTAATFKARPDLLEQALDETDRLGGQPFAALNAAFFSDGFILSLDPGVVLGAPLEIIHVGRAEGSPSLHLRNAVLLGAGSRATIFESFVGEGVYWTNAVSIMRLAEGARLDHAKLQDEGREAIHFAANRAVLAAGARFDSFLLTLGARLSRHDTLAAINGEGGECGLNGAYLLRGEQEATMATFVDHAAPGGTTREVFKGVVEERAHGIFLGKIAVRPHAQKTNAHQLNRNLLLSPRAVVDTKPELEILADDVKCSHGATIGDLDENALFYLRARGITEAEARRMLIEAFATDALDTVENIGIRAHLADRLQGWLAYRGE